MPTMPRPTHHHIITTTSSPPHHHHHIMSKLFFGAAITTTLYGVAVHAANISNAISNSPQNSVYLAALTLYAASIASHLLWSGQP